MGRFLLITIILASILLQFLVAKASPPTTYRIVGSVVSVASLGWGLATVQCNSGDYATGGGPTTSISSGPGPVSLQVSDSFPTLSSGYPRGWEVIAFNPTSISLNLAATVVCSSSATYRALGSPVNVTAGAYMSGGVSCSAGDYATGGGASASMHLSSNPSSLVISDIFPILTNGQVNGWRVYVYNPTSTTISMTPMVSCTKAFNIYRVVGTALSLAAGSYGTTQVYCTSGDYAIGGGPSTSVTLGPGRISLALSDSFADIGGGIPTGWRVYAYNPTNASLNLVSIIVCIGSAVTTGCGSQTCTVQTNATITPVTYSNNALHFNLTGTGGTSGHVNVTLPKSRVPEISKVVVYLNGTVTAFTHTANSTAYFVFFNVTFHSSYTVDISLGVTIAELPPGLALIPIFSAIIAILRSRRPGGKRKMTVSAAANLTEKGKVP